MDKNAPSDTFKKLYAKILGPLLKQLCEANPIFAVKVHNKTKPLCRKLPQMVTCGTTAEPAARIETTYTKERRQRKEGPISTCGDKNRQIAYLNHFFSLLVSLIPKNTTPSYSKIPTSGSARLLSYTGMLCKHPRMTLAAGMY